MTRTKRLRWGSGALGIGLVAALTADLSGQPPTPTGPRARQRMPGLYPGALSARNVADVAAHVLTFPAQ